jgi:hypothetical protein
MSFLYRISKTCIFFLFFLLTFCGITPNLFSQFQNPNDSTITICKQADSTRFNDLKYERQRLLIEISLIRKEKDSVEKDGYRENKTAKEIKRDLKNIEHDLKNAEHSLNRVQSKMNNIMRKIEKKYTINENDFVRFYGDCTIEPNDKINSNISVINGDIYIKGNIRGNLVVVNGKAYIQGGNISDRVILVNASIAGDSARNKYNEIICGDITGYDEYEYTWDDYRFFDVKWPNFHFPDIEWIDNGEVRYNRVEGLRLGAAGSKKYYWNSKKKYSIYGSFGYGFANHKWTGSIAYDRWIGNDNRTEIGAETHSIIDSKDNWLIDPNENSLAAFFIHEDFKDYYLRDGWSAHISQYIARETKINVQYAEETHQSQTLNTDWALFGGDKKFRANLPIDEGRYKSIIISLNHKSEKIKKYEPDGWDLSASYEITTGEYEYERLWVDLRRYQPLMWNHKINARVIVGSTHNTIPIQKSFDLGGLGTIPAMPFKYDSYGNRLALFNVEYLMGFDDIFNILFDDDFNINSSQDLVIFYDGGWLNYACPCVQILDGFKIEGNYRQDIGAAFSFDRSSIRIGAAFRLDKKEPATLFFRISKPI